MKNDMSVHDLTGLRCPQPLLALQRLAKCNSPGNPLILKVDDPVAWLDIQAWCNIHQHHCELLSPDIAINHSYSIVVELADKEGYGNR
jgi:TusA-related sulfurtransferase